jgi:hypothetical protein
MVRIEQESDAVHWEAEQIEHADDGSFRFGVHVGGAPFAVYARGIHKIGKLRDVPVVGVKQESDAVTWEAEHVEHADDGSSRLGVQVRDALSAVNPRGGIHKIDDLRYVHMVSVKQESYAVLREAEQVEHADDGSSRFGVHVGDVLVVI